MFEESGRFVLDTPILTPKDLKKVVGLMKKGALLSPCTLNIKIDTSRVVIKTKFFTHKRVREIDITDCDLLSVARDIQRHIQVVAETNASFGNLVTELEETSPTELHPPVRPLDLEGCRAIVGPCKYRATKTTFGKIYITDGKKRVCHGTKRNKKGLPIEFIWQNNRMDEELTLDAVMVAVRGRQLPEPFIAPIFEFLKENQLDFIKKLTKRPLNLAEIGEYDPIKVEVCKIAEGSQDKSKKSKKWVSPRRKWEEEKGKPWAKAGLRVFSVTEAEAANPKFLPALFVTIGQNKRKYFCQDHEGNIFKVANTLGRHIQDPIDPDDEFLKIKIEKALEKHGL
jgi:hypothetical protein